MNKLDRYPAITAEKKPNLFSGSVNLQATFRDLHVS